MNDKVITLAQDVLRLSRNTLLVNLRFLDMALSQFTLIPIQQSTLLTDGEHILYNPKHVLESYRARKEIPVRDYLHTVMHCVFRHMYIDLTMNHTYWDLACDIAVENVITELNLKSTTTPREKQQEQYIAAIRKELKHVAAEKIYGYLRKTVPSETEIAKIRGIFYADNHELWYMTSEEIASKFAISPSEKSGEGEGDDNGDGASSARKAMSNVWQNIAQRMQVDMETFGKQHGVGSGSLTQNLAAVNREKYDYTAFLKKFAVMGERMKINDDEFDYIFYTYGL